MPTEGDLACKVYFDNQLLEVENASLAFSDDIKLREDIQISNYCAGSLFSDEVKIIGKCNINFLCDRYYFYNLFKLKFPRKKKKKFIGTKSLRRKIKNVTRT